MNAEILVGPERRRRWSVEEKARIVAEASAPDTRVADIARRYGVSRSLIYTWRREARQGLLLDGSAGAALPELVPVIMSGASSDVAAREKHRSHTNGAAKPDGAIEIALPGNVRMTVRGLVEERTLRAVLGALRLA
ncbi:MAG: transposase [Alphaproteobacteria bacterium]|nr:transposase [Alphaproteobacteria bacterium]MBV9481747.1 transposase [Acidobacteriota bacterium]MBV9966596.1 transposase [Alphaproteobacteria bacterium]